MIKPCRPEKVNCKVMPPILMEIDEIRKNGRKKLKEVEDHPTYSEEQRQGYIEMKTEKQARLKILSQNQKDF